MICSFLFINIAGDAAGGIGLGGILGRTHPLVLHLPIGIAVALAVVELCTWFFGLDDSRKSHGMLAVFGALSAWISVATGFLLNSEGSYPEADVDPHRNFAIACAAALTLSAFAFLKSGGGKRGGAMAIYRLFLLIALVLMIPAGHLGASLTHGEGFLTGGIVVSREEGGSEKKNSNDNNNAGNTENAAAAAANAEFTNKILPILESRCTGCHGAGERKGKLALHTREAMLGGGKNGSIFNITDPKEGSFYSRISREMEEKGHMPPKSKPQLSAEELKTLQDWILAGKFTNMSAEGNITDTAEAPAKPAGAPAEALKALADALVHAQPIQQDSHLLWVDFAATAARMEEKEILQLLAPIKEHVSDLSLNRSKITDTGIAEIAKFPALRRLEIRSTSVGDAGIASLAASATLEELVIAQTRATAACVDDLLKLQKLAKIYIWGAAIPADAVARLREARPGLAVDAGDAPAAAALESEQTVKLTNEAPVPGAAPAAGAPASLEPVNTACPVSGQPVVPKYQIVFEGRVIGFCCPNCPGKFWANPEEFKAKLPK